MISKFKNKNIYVIYTILFILICFIIFVPFLLRGNTLIANADVYHQTFPVFVYTKEFWSNLLTGNTRFFDFSLGFGEDVFAVLAWPGVFDILSAVISLICPIEYVEVAYGINILIRIYLCGIAFIYYVERYIKIKKLEVIGAVFYAFNTYTLFWGVYCYPFITAAMLLPFVLRGIDNILENKKIDIVMIIALFLQGLNGFYMLYLIVMACIFYFVFVAIFRMFLREKNTFKEIVRKGINIAFNGLLGILLSGVVFIPSVYGLFSSTREVGKDFSVELFCGLDNVVHTLGEFLVPNVYNSVITFSLVTFGGVVTYFFVKNKKKEFLYITIVLWCLLWCPLWGSIMNGFSYSTDRWFFILSFFSNVTMVLALDEEETMPNVAFGIYLLFSVSSLVIHVINSEKNLGLGIRIFVFCILIAGLRFVWQKQKKRESVIVLFSFVVTSAMGLFIYGPKVVGGNGYSANFKPYGVYQEILDSSSELERTETAFERWDIYDSSYAASLVAEYAGTTEYFSTLNGNIYNFFKTMCISPSIRGSSFCVQGLDGRKELISLLSTSYYMDFITKDNERNSIIYKNENYLPLGFTYNTYILEDDFNKLSVLNKNSQLINTIVLNEENPEITKGQVVSKVEKGINFKVLDQSEEIKRIYLDFEEYQELWKKRIGSVYVQIEDFHGEADVYIGNKYIQMKGSSFTYYTGIEEFWVNLTEIKKDLNGWYFDIKIQGQTDFKPSKMKIYWDVIDFDTMNTRGKNVLNDLNIDNSNIKGNITCKEKEMLFLSIPYNSGWKAYNNGVLTDIYKANIGFMAIPLEEGENYIELSYKTPGLDIGVICSLISFAIIVIYMICINKKSHGINGGMSK